MWHLLKNLLRFRRHDIKIVSKRTSGCFFSTWHLLPFIPWFHQAWICDFLRVVPWHSLLFFHHHLSKSRKIQVTIHSLLTIVSGKQTLFFSPQECQFFSPDKKGWLFLLLYPYHPCMIPIFAYIWLVFYGKCRYIYPTRMVWDTLSFVLSQRHDISRCVEFLLLHQCLWKVQQMAICLTTLRGRDVTSGLDGLFGDRWYICWMRFVTKNMKNGVMFLGVDGE